MSISNQIEYCKFCKKQSFDIKSGVICSLTNQKANFEISCPDFEIETAIIHKEEKEYEKINQSKVAFGMTPKQTGQFFYTEWSKQEVFAILKKAIENLNWNIDYISKSGFIVFTKFSMSSYSEKLEIVIEVGKVKISSECTGNQLIDWGKNRKNINSLISEFNQIKENENIDILTESWKNENILKADETEDLLDVNNSNNGFLSMFIPREGYFITPILIILNILIFILMAISGVHILMPENESLLIWGANFQPLTLEGEWWRLFTSTFIHIGIIHLFVNMYALIYIGILLEPILGKLRFASAYVLSGILGSALSLYWNEYTISAGASGAIFGMYGVFLALLSSNIISKESRKALFTSIGVFVLFNLANGFKEGVDGAGHFGGLIGGLLIGFSFIPGLLKDHKVKTVISLVGSLVLTIILSLGALAYTNNDLSNFDKDMVVFAENEEKALKIYHIADYADDNQLLYELQNNGIPLWKENKLLIEKMKEYDLPEVLQKQNELLLEYCDLRIKSYELIEKMLKEQTHMYEKEIASVNAEIQSLLGKLGGEN